MSKKDIKAALEQKKVENQRTTAMEGLKRSLESISLQIGKLFLALVKGNYSLSL